MRNKALRLSYFTVGYNLLEGIASVASGLAARSIALVGFGVDSFIESISGSIMIWRFSKHGNLTEEEEEKIEQRAIKLVAYSFFILSVYVFYESGKKLLFHEAPEKSLFGIVITVLSLIIMPALFYLKYQTGKSIGSRSLVVDAKQTLVCVIMSATVLLGLAANYFFHIWWFDQLVGLLIAIVLVKEGYEAYKEGKLCHY